ncbi:MAG: AMP-dependent synthetase/ligase [Terriglobales bacterium]
MGIRTLNDIFFSVVDRKSDCVSMCKQSGKWVPVSSMELYRDVLGVAKVLKSWGMQNGDRAAILSENRLEWAVADFATMCIRGIVVPIYATLPADQIGCLLQDAGVKILFLSTVDQLKKFRQVQAQTSVEKVVIMDDVPDSDAIPMQPLMQSGPTDRDAAVDAEARATSPDDVATIIYTSGTTGQQKGAILTHGNLAANISVSMDGYPINIGRESYISFLPLSHVTARHVDYAMYYRGITLVYQPDMNKLLETLQEIRPTLFVAIPRVYEKIRHNVEHKTATGLKHSIYTWAVHVGRENRETILRGETPKSATWTIANKLLYSKVREAVGGRVKYFISGGAPLGRELAEWYADIGIRIHEGYGLTETSPVIALNTPVNHRLGTVGKLLSNVEVRVADDGEILVRAPSVFRGYWNRPEETAKAFDGEWFKTGDIGNVDIDGYLSITDRKKDLIKTSGGKFIAPQPIESALKNHELISEAAVLGDRRKFAAALIRPDFDLLQAWATENGVAFQHRDDLIQHPKVIALYESLLNEVNAKLAQFEKMKKFILIPDDFTIANGFLTPTMKLRRRVIEERYRQEIEALYAEAASNRQSNAS